MPAACRRGRQERLLDTGWGLLMPAHACQLDLASDFDQMLASSGLLAATVGAQTRRTEGSLAGPRVSRKHSRLAVLGLPLCYAESA